MKYQTRFSQTNRSTEDRIGSELCAICLVEINICASSNDSVNHCSDNTRENHIVENNEEEKLTVLICQHVFHEEPSQLTYLKYVFLFNVNDLKVVPATSCNCIRNCYCGVTVTVTNTVTTITELQWYL